MTWLALESKMFTSVAYDAKQRILYLRFSSGDVYRYFQFSKDDYQHLVSAESKGRHFLTNIRNCFPYERMAKAPSRLIKSNGPRLSSNGLPERDIFVDTLSLPNV
jgi:KTSC domain